MTQPPCPDTQDRPFYLSVGPTVNGSSPLFLARPKQETCCRHPLQAQLPHMPSQGTADSASTCQQPLQAANVPCQGLTFEQRPMVPDVMSLVICADRIPCSCPNKSCWHCLLLLWNFFGMDAADAFILSDPTLLILSWASITAHAYRLSTQVMRSARRCLVEETMFSTESLMYNKHGCALSYAFMWRFVQPM